MNLRTRIKICGITTLKDAEIAVESGADAIGLMFYSKSPRYIELKRAKAIANAVGPFVTVVSLFVNARVEEIKRCIDEVEIDYIQFHGDETPEFCRQFPLPYIKAVRVAQPETNNENGISAVQQQVIHESQLHCQLDDSSKRAAQAILLDTLHPKHFGGSGLKFDWRCVPTSNNFRWILAGGLNPENIANAIEQTNPYAVDVSSGVESEPGVKDPEKMRQFIANVRQMN